MVWLCYCFIDGHFKKCINVHIIIKEKKVKLISHDYLPILMLLYIMLYLMPAYLRLFVCIMLFFLSFFCHSFCKCFFFLLCLCLLTQFVHFKYDFPSCAVLLICWFFIILCSHRFFNEKGMCSLEKWHLKITIIIIIIPCIHFLFLQWYVLFLQWYFFVFYLYAYFFLLCLILCPTVPPPRVYIAFHVFYYIYILHRKPFAHL